MNYYYNADSRAQQKLKLIFERSKYATLKDYIEDCIDTHHQTIQRGGSNKLFVL